jgi:hypothetical protein
MTQAEVARRAGTSQPNVNRTERGVSVPELATLRRMLRACGFDVELRLIEKQRSRLADLVESRRDAISAAARRHGARHVRVFGSVARRSPRARDVDFLVSLEPGRDIVDLASLRRELEDLLGVRVDVTTLDLLRPEARREAAREAVPL